MTKKRAPYFMILPFFLVYVAFSIYPIVYSLVISFLNWDGISTPSFAGLTNYIRAFTKDPFFYKSLTNSMILMAFSIPIQIALGLLMACVLKDFLKKTRNGFQLINFLPYVTTPVAIGLIFQQMFNWKSGIVNAGLGLIGLDSVYWLGETWPARVVVILTIIWKNYGYMMIMFLSGLSSISPKLYDAAKIDGANWVQSFFKITIPLLRPIFNFVIVTCVINGFRLFDEPQLLFQSDTQPIGGPNRSVLTMIMRFYEVSFRDFQFGYGTALAFSLFIIMGIITMILYAVLNAKGDD